jgi:hypothetical protein
VVNICLSAFFAIFPPQLLPQFAIFAAFSSNKAKNDQNRAEKNFAVNHIFLKRAALQPPKSPRQGIFPTRKLTKHLLVEAKFQHPRHPPPKQNAKSTALMANALTGEAIEIRRRPAGIDDRVNIAANGPIAEFGNTGARAKR